MSQTDQIVFKTIVAHRNPHMDELVACALLAQMNPGSEVKFLEDSDISVSDRTNPLVAIVGTLGGRFDEHKEDGRLTDTCATMLVAEYLEIKDIPEYQVLLSEVLRADTKRGQTYLELGEMVKTIHEYGDEGMDEYWMFGFVSLVLRTHLQRQANQSGREFRNFTAPCLVPKRVGVVAIPAGAPLTTLVKAWLVMKYAERKFSTLHNLELRAISSDAALDKVCTRTDVLMVGFEGGHFPDSMKVREVAGQLGISGKQDRKTFNQIKLILRAVEAFENSPGTAKPFSLGVITENLNRHGELPAPVIYQQIAQILGCYVRRSVEFHELCPENYDATGKGLELSGLKVAFVRSDLRTMPAYCRAMLEADVVVVRRNGGNCAIFTNGMHKAAVFYIAEEILLAEAERVRFRELDTEKLDRTVLTGRGRDLPEPAEHWYFFAENGCLLNGSHSHRDVPATQLTNRQIREAVERALAEYKR